VNLDLTITQFAGLCAAPLLLGIGLLLRMALDRPKPVRPRAHAIDLQHHRNHLRRRWAAGEEK